MRQPVFGQGRAHGLGPCEKKTYKRRRSLSFFSFLALLRVAACTLFQYKYAICQSHLCILNSYWIAFILLSSGKTRSYNFELIIVYRISYLVGKLLYFILENRLKYRSSLKTTYKHTSTYKTITMRARMMVHVTSFYRCM